MTDEELQQLASQVAIILSANSQGVGEVEVATSLDRLVSLPAIRLDGTIETVVVAPISLLRGSDGREIETQVTDTYWQWRYKGETAWKNMLSLDTLKGLSAFQLWKQEEGNEDKTYEEYTAYLRQPATDAKTEWDDTYKPDIDTKVALLEELNAHPTKVFPDNYVYEWSLETHTYVKTDIYVKGDPGAEWVTDLSEESGTSGIVVVETGEPTVLENWEKEW